MRLNCTQLASWVQLFIIPLGLEMSQGKGTNVLFRDKRELCYRGRDDFFACVDEHNPDWTREVRRSLSATLSSSRAPLLAPALHARPPSSKILLARSPHARALAAGPRSTSLRRASQQIPSPVSLRLVQAL